MTSSPSEKGPDPYRILTVKLYCRVPYFQDNFSDWGECDRHMSESATVREGRCFEIAQRRLIHQTTQRAYDGLITLFLLLLFCTSQKADCVLDRQPGIIVFIPKTHFQSVI
jgi:hypothetical protein